MKGGERMIPSLMEEYLFNDIGAPKIIKSNAQLKEYVTALVELDRASHLTAAEQNFAELLILLIEAYVDKPHPRRLASRVDLLQELSSKGDLSGKN